MSPETVVEATDPVTPPGFIVHVPAGRPLKTTLPVANEHVGCVIVPTIGAEGLGGSAGITMVEEVKDTHPPAFVTV